MSEIETKAIDVSEAERGAWDKMERVIRAAFTKGDEESIKMVVDLAKISSSVGADMYAAYILFGNDWHGDVKTEIPKHLDEYKAACRALITAFPNEEG